MWTWLSMVMFVEGGTGWYQQEVSFTSRAVTWRGVCRLKCANIYLSLSLSPLNIRIMLVPTACNIPWRRKMCPSVPRCALQEFYNRVPELYVIQLIIRNSVNTAWRELLYHILSFGKIVVHWIHLSHSERGQACGK